MIKKKYTLAHHIGVNSKSPQVSIFILFLCKNCFLNNSKELLTLHQRNPSMGNSHILAGPECRKEEGIMQSDIEQSEHFLKSQSSTAAIPNLLGGLTEPLII